VKKTGIQNRVRLSAEGLAKVLGDLEARVLRAVWQLGEPATAREVHAVVVRRHRVELPTVITVLNNLTGKGVLRRAKRDELLHYEARMSREEFMAMASRRVVEGILSLGPQAVSASLVDVLAARDPAQLAELGRLVRRKLREQEEG
jgi:predicted transcriptional regulator